MPNERKCQVCQGPIRSPDFTLCFTHYEEFQGMLRRLPSLLTDLDATIRREATFGRSARGGGGEQLVMDFEASDRKSKLLDTLKRFGLEPGVIYSQEWLRSWVVAGEAYRQIRAAFMACLRVVDRPAARIKVGRCGGYLTNDDGEVWECQRELIAFEDARYVRCKACGTEWDVKARQESALEQAFDIVLHAAQAAKVLREYGMRITPKDVQNWMRANKITAAACDVQTRRPLYRLADVYDHARAMGR